MFTSKSDAVPRLFDKVSYGSARTRQIDYRRPREPFNLYRVTNVEMHPLTELIEVASRMPKVAIHFLQRLDIDDDDRPAIVAQRTTAQVLAYAEARSGSTPPDGGALARCHPDVNPAGLLRPRRIDARSKQGQFDR